MEPNHLAADTPSSPHPTFEGAVMKTSTNLSTSTPKKSLRTRGQGMTEYIIIVALIAIAAIGVITLFGDNIKALFGMSSDALSGQPNVGNRTRASNRVAEHKTMSTFGKDNSGY
jgi:Flp pilus assembly pilin Flp